MPLSTRHRRQLRSLAHHLNPVVTIGNKGLNTAVLREIELSLEHHELIKIRCPAGDREERLRLYQDIERHTGGELVQSIGRVGVLYRPADPPRIELGP